MEYDRNSETEEEKEKEEQIWVGKSRLNYGTTHTLFTYTVFFTNMSKYDVGKRAEETCRGLLELNRL